MTHLESLTLRQIAFSYTGRISRATFWGALLCIPVAQLIVVFTLGAISDSLHMATLALVGFVFWFPLLAWVSFAVQVKRWHYLGITGWAVLVNIVPIINILVIIIALGMMPGRSGANEYGENPLPAPTQ